MARVLPMGIVVPLPFWMTEEEEEEGGMGEVMLQLLW